jgi:IstB-like ATP binding protein
MLLNQTLDKLDALGLFGMAMGVREQLESTHYANLSFEERLGVLVDREAETRDSRRLALRLKAAKLRQAATVEDLDFRTPRGMDRSVIMNLAQAGWVNARHNLLITGPTGAGKSFRSVRTDPRGRASRAHRPVRAYPATADGTSAQPWRRAVRPSTGVPGQDRGVGSGRLLPDPAQHHRSQRSAGSDRRSQPGALDRRRQPTPSGELARRTGRWRSDVGRCDRGSISE